MKWIGVFLLMNLGAGPFTRAFSQCPAVDLNLPPSSCLNQNLFVTNLTGPGNYLWDFCAGDFSNTPTTQSLFSLSAANGRPGVEFAKDGSIWYGFVTGTYSNTLYRLTFANGTSNLPTLTENLADLSGALSGPGQVRIINESGQWYGLIYNTALGQLLKLNFGDKLSNTVVTSVLASGINATTSGGFAVEKDPVQGWVCVMTNASNSFTLLRLGNSLSTPGPSDILNTSTIPNPNSLGDVDLINVCGNWYGFAADFGNTNIHRLEFGSDLFSNPVIDQLTTLSVSNPGVANPGRLRITQEGEEYFLFVVSLDGNLTKLEFGSDPSQSPTIVNDGNVAINVYGLAVAKENSAWTLLAVSQSSGQTYEINYPNNCPASTATSLLQNPQVSYAQPGTYQVSLKYTSGSGTSVKTKTTTVSASPAPDIDFTTQNSCVNNNVDFTIVNSSGNLISYAWDFGDGNADMSNNPAHSYTTSGTFTINLSVGASNGCANAIDKALTIFNQPVAGFILPSANPICTNQNYTFTNNSTFDVGSSPTWEWRVNSVLVSGAQDLSYAFPSATPQQVELTALIAGCSNDDTQIINSVQAGPVVDFAVSNACQELPVTFTNATVGSGLTYTWSFGDGNTSAQISPVNIYSAFGSFSVNLVASSSNGCQNSSTKTVTIYSTPKTDFSLALPPFSCSGTPSQFTDTTPNPTDSNLASWAWNFGDPANGTSAQQNPLYTYANPATYNVSLTVTTDFECSATTQKMITITQSPTASFTNTPACVDQPTQFTDTSGPGIKSWVWQIDNSTFTINNPIYVFGSSATYAAQLTVTGNNNCIAQVTKPIIVPVPQVPDFSSLSTCAGKPAVFQDTTPAVGDPTVSWAWNFADQAIGSGSPVQYIFPTTGNFSVSMSNTAQSGCVYTVTKTVSIVTAPQANFTTSVSAGAAPLGMQFTNTSLNATSYLWHFNDLSNATSAVVSPSFTYTGLGDYVVDLTAFGAQSCSDTFSQIIMVVVPQVDAALDQLQFVRDAVTGELQALFYIENKGNLPLSNPTIVLDISGSASIKQNLSLTISPGQTASQALNYSLLPSGLTYVCVSVEEAGDVDLFNNKQCVSLTDDEVVFAPYPNPTGGELRIDWIASAEGSAQVTIFTSTGEKAFDRQLTSSSTGLNQILLDVSNLHSGVYLAVFKYLGLRKTFRFIVN